MFQLVRFDAFSPCPKLMQYSAAGQLTADDFNNLQYDLATHAHWRAARFADEEADENEDGDSIPRTDDDVREDDDGLGVEDDDADIPEELELPDQLADEPSFLQRYCKGLTEGLKPYVNKKMPPPFYNYDFFLRAPKPATFKRSEYHTKLPHPEEYIVPDVLVWHASILPGAPAHGLLCTNPACQRLGPAKLASNGARSSRILTSSR